VKQLLILGGGYTGQAIYKFATAQELAVRATSRAPARHLSSLPSDHRIAFDLARPETWENVSPDIPIIWCFPAVPLEAVMAFAERCAAGARKLIVLGSTSAYDPPSPRTGIAAAALVDERTPVNLQRPRVQGGGVSQGPARSDHTPGGGNLRPRPERVEVDQGGTRQTLAQVCEPDSRGRLGGNLSRCTGAGGFGRELQRQRWYSSTMV